VAEEIAFKNGRISNFQGLVILTLDRVILHCHASCMRNLIEIEETFCGRTDGLTYTCTFQTHFIKSTQLRVDLIKYRERKEEHNRGVGYTIRQTQTHAHTIVVAAIFHVNLI